MSLSGKCTEVASIELSNFQLRCQKRQLQQCQGEPTTVPIMFTRQVTRYQRKLDKSKRNGELESFSE